MRNDSPASLPYVRCIAWIVVLGLIVPATVPATASAQERRVVVVPGLEPGDLAALTDQGAVGLLVPDAGPKTSGARARARSEEHTSELQSHSDLVCRLLLEKKKRIDYHWSLPFQKKKQTD